MKFSKSTIEAMKQAESALFNSALDLDALLGKLPRSFLGIEKDRDLMREFYAWLMTAEELLRDLPRAVNHMWTRTQLVSIHRSVLDISHTQAYDVENTTIETLIEIMKSMCAEALTDTIRDLRNLRDSMEFSVEEVTISTEVDPGIEKSELVTSLCDLLTGMTRSNAGNRIDRAVKAGELQEIGGKRYSQESAMAFLSVQKPVQPRKTDYDELEIDS